MKKIIALVLSIALVFALATTAFASSGAKKVTQCNKANGSVVITNGNNKYVTNGKVTYGLRETQNSQTAYKITNTAIGYRYESATCTTDGKCSSFTGYYTNKPLITKIGK